MSKLSWVTPLGSLTNVFVGQPMSVTVLATDDTYSSSPINYKLIFGNLPLGLTLNSNGTISGTPTYDPNIGNYFTQLTFPFSVRAYRSNLDFIDGNFSILISNVVNNDFAWATPEGTLGTIPHSEFVSVQLLAQDSANSKISYEVISGSLPPGTEIVKNDVIFDVTAVVVTTQDITSLNIINLGGDVTIPIGATVIGPYIPANTTVTDIDRYNKTVTLSNSTSAQLTQGTSVNFYQLQFLAGTLLGVPTNTSPTLINQSVTYSFSIRATNAVGHIIDRSFQLTVTNVSGPVIEPSSPILPGTQNVNLGSVFDGQYYNEQLSVIELNSNAVIQWSVVKGTLPNGTTLSANGLISGFIIPVQLVGSYGPAGYDGDVIDAASGTIIQQQEYDLGPYEFGQRTASTSYNFTIQAYDGANYDIRSYTLSVLSRSGFTADTTSDTADNESITVDSSSTYLPVILNTVTTLPAVRQGSYYAFKVDGFDFQDSTLTYYISDYAGTFDCEILGIDDGFDYDPFDQYVFAVGTTTTALPGLALDASTGWIYGQITTQIEALLYYSFGVYCTKPGPNGTTITSETVIFTLPVLGDVNNTIKWVSPANLGTINNGSISDLSVMAHSTENKQLVYSLIDSSVLPCALPQGLKLLPSGDIAGRVSFEAFAVDNYATTFDGNALTFDRTFKFYVKASTIENDASSTQEFTLTLDIIDIAPYNNIYLQAMPADDQRKIYQATVNNTEIFVPDLIYRPTDPNFGVQQNISMLFLPGLKPEDVNTYEQAIALNHYTKTFTFGSIKTAVVLDESYNTKYEVVYIEIIDPELNSKGNGPPLSIDLSKEIKNPYIDAAGNTYHIVYPNTSQDMIQRLIDNIGYQDQSSLPPWMISNQPGTNGTTFNTPLGYTRAVVLAYTVKGASNLIAYRLKNSGINFNKIQFTTDRYFVDNFYSSNFNTSSYRYITGKETTFDVNPKNIGSIVGTVQYGVTIPFDQINGRPVSYINSNGGLDGKTDWQNGDTIIFIKQESFPGNELYDGWVSYSDAYIGDNISTVTTEGYDSEGYDSYSFVPGYLEKIQSVVVVNGNPVYGVTNKRGGIWQINIVGEEVGLTFVTEVELNQRVRINRGATYGGALVYYNSILTGTQKVPAYSLYSVTISSVQKRTTFNGDSTRFFSNIDTYYTPGSNDKYLKFPQTGAFT